MQETQLRLSSSLVINLCKCSLPLNAGHSLPSQYNIVPGNRRLSLTLTLTLSLYFLKSPLYLKFGLF